MASGKMQMSQVCADDSPLDGATDLFCIFSLTSGGTVASAVDRAQEAVQELAAHRSTNNPHVDAFQCVMSMLCISINLDARCNNLRVSFKWISSQSPSSSVSFFGKNTKYHLYSPMNALSKEFRERKSALRTAPNLRAH